MVDRDLSKTPEESERVAGRAVEIAGIPLKGAAGLVGELILKQAQQDMVLDQLAILHGKRSGNANYRKCGLLYEVCKTWVPSRRTDCRGKEVRRGSAQAR